MIDNWGQVSLSDVKYSPLNGKMIFKPGNIPVELSTTVINKTGVLFFNPEGVKPISIYANPTQLANTLRSLADRLDPPNRPQTPTTDDTPMHLKKGPFPQTPAEVIAYFYNSPALAGIAPDVESALKHYVGAYQPDDVTIIRQKMNPEDLFDETGKPVWGAQSQVAAMLGIPNAGSHRGRILSVLTRLYDQLSTSTSTIPNSMAQKAVA